MKLCIRLLCGKERHNWINPDLFISLTTFMQQNYGRLEMELSLMADVAPVEFARNKAALDCMQQKADWLLMIDNDQVLPANLGQLIAAAHANKEINIVSLPTYMLRPGEENPMPTVNSWVERDSARRGVHRSSLPNMPGFQEILSGGAGVMLIRARMFKELQAPWFKVLLGDRTCAPLCGEDDFFNNRAREAGFKVHTHSGYQCGHFKTVDLAAYSLHCRPSDADLPPQ
jgi:GT2 family glycosyltransferase